MFAQTEEERPATLREKKVKTVTNKLIKASTVPESQTTDLTVVTSKFNEDEKDNGKDKKHSGQDGKSSGKDGKSNGKDEKSSGQDGKNSGKRGKRGKMFNKAMDEGESDIGTDETDESDEIDVGGYGTKRDRRVR